MFTNDTSQLTAFQQDTSCYGGVGSPYPVTALASWSSYTPDIATVDMGGVAEGVSAGDGSISAGWEAATWEYGGAHFGCIYSPVQAFANSLCNVLRPPVIFNEVTWSDQRATFSYPENRATLNLGGDRLTSAACGGQQFSINVTFRQPDSSAGCCHSQISNFVSAPSSEYVVLASDFYEEGTATGQVSVTLKRTGEGTRKSVIITVGGTYQSGDSWSSPGTVTLQCP